MNKVKLRKTFTYKNLEFMIKSLSEEEKLKEVCVYDSFYDRVAAVGAIDHLCSVKNQNIPCIESPLVLILTKGPRE